jgi:TetR/AcrR family fatty acid metabolism transcriptional regulator
MSEHSLMNNLTNTISGNGLRREAILTAAQKVFARNGFHEARISAIAREAGIAEGTIYNYFSSREEIYLSLFDDRWRTFTEKIRSRTSSMDDPNKKLKAIFAAAMKTFITNKSLAQIFLLETSPGSVFLNSRVALRLADFLDLIEEILIEGKRAGTYHPDLDTRVARMVIYGTVQGILFSWMLKEHAPPDIRRRFRFSMIRASQTIKLILKSGITSPPGHKGRSA